METVKVKAIKRGNLNTPFGSFHFDPKGHKDARVATVRVEVAKLAKEKGLVELVAYGSEVLTGDALYEVTAHRRETSITQNDEETRIVEVLGLNAADTRDTTAFEVDPSKFARTGVQEVESTVGDNPNELDEDDFTGEGNDATGTDTSGTFTADDARLQEGDARGPDSPPRDEGDAMNQAGSGTGNGEDGDAGSKQQQETGTEQTGEQGQDSKAQAPAPAPKPKRASRAASEM